MALFWRIWAAVTVVTLAVLTISVTFATLQFGNINAALVGERLIVLANRTAAPFEAAARIGLPLSSTRNAKALLERARQTDDTIVAIHVFDPAGTIVHSTAASPPDSIPAEALAARSAASGSPWHREVADGFFSGIDITSGDGTSVGGILVVYPLDASNTRINAMAAELALAAAVALLAAAALGGPLLALALKRQIRMFDAIDSAIANFERITWRKVAGWSPPTEHAEQGELHGLLLDAENRYLAEGERLAKARSSPK